MIQFAAGQNMHCLPHYVSWLAIILAASYGLSIKAQFVGVVKSNTIYIKSVRDNSWLNYTKMYMINFNKANNILRINNTTKARCE